MVILVVHIVAISTVEAEGDPPVAIDIHCPLPFAAALERMESQPRGVQIPKARCCLKPRQNSTDLLNVLRVQSSNIASFKKSFQSAVPEPDDHLAERNLQRVGGQPVVDEQAAGVGSVERLARRLARKTKGGGPPRASCVLE